MPIKKQDLANQRKKAKKLSFDIYDPKLTSKALDAYVQNNAVQVLDPDFQELDDHAYGKLHDGTITLNFALDTDQYHEIKIEDVPKSLNLDKLDDPDYWYDGPRGIKQSMYFTNAYISTEFKTLDFNCYVLYANLPKDTKTVKINISWTTPALDDIKPGYVVAVPIYFNDDLVMPGNLKIETFLNRYVEIFSQDLTGEVKRAVNCSWKLRHNMIKKMEEFNILASTFNKFVSMSDYAQLHYDLKSIFSQYFARYDMNILINSNIRVALAGLLEDTAKMQLPSWHQIKASSSRLLNSGQLAAVNSNEPFMIIAAGAGTGKTTTIVERMKRLLSSGIDTDSIMFLSFTNSAVDEVKKRVGKQIKVSTYAKFIQDVYSANYNHVLTNDGSLANMVSAVRFTGEELKTYERLDYAQRRLTTDLRAFVHEKGKVTDFSYVQSDLLELFLRYREEVDLILNKVQYTSLNLQPIAVYAKIILGTDIKYPDYFKKLKYVFTDETQDTATFEYMLIVKFAQMNAWSMSIVGDANQNLYAFRGADPEMFTALTDIFKTYPLTTNYRSRQEILNYANVFLVNMKTNQKRKIRLHTPLASDQLHLKDGVVQGSKSSIGRDMGYYEYYHELSNAFSSNTDAMDYIKSCVNKGQQVAILAYTNQEVNMLERIINKKFGNARSIRLQSTSSQDVSDVTSLLALCSPDSFNPAMANTFVDYVYAKFSQKVNLLEEAGHQAPRLKNFMTWLENKTWDKKLNDEAKYSIMMKEAAESERISSTMRQISKAQTKESIPQNNIILSTVHQVKGMEFDNCLIFTDENSLSGSGNESQLRVLYVALTRGKNSEFVYVNVNPSVKTITMANAPVRFANQQLS